MHWKTVSKWLLASTVVLVLAGVLAACSSQSAPSPTATPVATSGVRQYANPDLLVSTDWLAQHLNDSNVVVVDVRKASDFPSAHIQGSVNLDTKDSKGLLYDQSSKTQWIVAPKEQIESVVGGAGIGNNTIVVAVDEDKMLWASRLFWTLEYYGHDKGLTRVLDGGLAKWKAENRPLTDQIVKRQAATFTAKVDPSRIALKDQILANLGKPETVILATIPEGEFNGSNAKNHLKGGHIPGALQLDWTANLTSGDVPVLKSASELAAQYEGLGITEGKNAVLY